MVGGWFGTRLTGRRVHALLAGLRQHWKRESAEHRRAQRPAVFTRVCGGLSTGGTFEQSANQFGGFAGYAGALGFIDGAFPGRTAITTTRATSAPSRPREVVKFNAATGV
jgi:hypothetical protein